MPHLCVSLAGRTPLCGESHVLLPPDARPRRRVQQEFVARPRPSVVDMSATCQRLCKDWSRIEREWGGGNESPRSEFAPGAPVRFALAGVGGARFLGMTPCPIAWQLWSEVNRDTVSVAGVPLVWMDVGLRGAQRLAQRTPRSSRGSNRRNFPLRGLPILLASGSLDQSQ